MCWVLVYSVGIMGSSVINGRASVLDVFGVASAEWACVGWVLDGRVLGGYWMGVCWVGIGWACMKWVDAG